mgnify:CR=1 FL=1
MVIKCLRRRWRQSHNKARLKIVAGPDMAGVKVVGLYGVADELAPCLYVELLEDPREVGLHGRLGYVEPARNFLVSQSFSDERDDLFFPDGK